MLERDKLTTTTVNLGLGANILLSFAKTLVGILGHSSALLADGINSSSDVVYYVAVKIFMHQARKPADAEHPYGHRQLETISAIVVGAFILTTGIAILWDSINKVFDLLSGYTVGRSASILALWIAIGTLALKLYLYHFTRRTSRRINNPTIRALANDHLNDIMASLAVIIGVVLGQLGYFWMDPAAGAIVAIYIIKTGIGIIMDSSGELMDSVPDPEFGKLVRSLALRVEGVRRIEELGVHRFGPYFTINMTIGVNGRIAVEEGHKIAHSVEAALLNNFDSSLRSVHIHYHPAELTESNPMEKS
ncbi:MAG: cation transporter [Candidatus Cloacimonetes bacterium]|nr:cation transporter [Candidatus Cloacimonadota bacterium]HNZ07044.1 cation diffusion facilitator family transporter [Candidatus Cloacimonadota bacterium]HOH78819.1 cation diffusion facilitator family transporter [Candidatus Cloacimonadota bacterium]HPN40320.1 cation diffusion facilitator family transporter [Candidatus Cloacimonadota bacterium]